MMSLNARARRISDGTTSGRRGRPESLVRQFWEDIETEGVGPKCVFCDHRSVTRVFRAPPATRHTLICKNAPEHVKARLRRATNNKYSRRPPPSDASAAAAAVGVAPSDQQPHHQVQQPVQAQPQVQQPLEQPSHSQPQQAAPTHTTSQPTHQAPPAPQQQPQQQFTFKPPPGGPEQGQQDTGLQNMSSPRHITAGVVTGMNVASPNPMQTGAMESVVPMRTALLNDRARVTHGGVLSPGTTDILYANANNQRILATEEMGNGLERANAALAAAVVESLFTGQNRKKEGAVPTPAEFRAALQEAKESARSKAKRQRNEARAESQRLQSAISFLVGSKSVGGRAGEMESDDSDEEFNGVVGQVANARRNGEWVHGYEHHKQIIMPKVSPTMTAGRLIDWKKHEGEAFSEGDDIADVESDKATMPISAREDGYIARIFVQPDTPDIPLGQLLAITVEEEEHIAAFKDYVPLSTDPSPIRNSSPLPASTDSASDPRQYTGPLGPAIKRILNEFPHLDLHAITPTGPKGRLLKGDVLAAIENQTASSESSVPKSEPKHKSSTFTVLTREPDISATQSQDKGRLQNYTDIPVSSMRRSIAKRLLLSKTTVPHLYASADYYLDSLFALRKQINAVDPSPRISVNDFIIRAAGIALRRVPDMNVFWDQETGTAVANDRVDVSMAVAIPGGLITPIVTDADRRGLVEIAEVTKDLATRAKEGTLAAEEFEGGCFSISNLGMYGISRFSAIINPPQSGILAVGSGIQRVTVGDDGTLTSVTQGMATLSTDARLVEEKTAAKFLKEFTSCLTNPENMLA